LIVLHRRALITGAAGATLLWVFPVPRLTLGAPARDPFWAKVPWDELVAVLRETETLPEDAPDVIRILWGLIRRTPEELDFLEAIAAAMAASGPISDDRRDVLRMLFSVAGERGAPALPANSPASLSARTC
jgi:hypothetical protein